LRHPISPRGDHEQHCRQPQATEAPAQWRICWIIVVDDASLHSLPAFRNTIGAPLPMKVGAIASQ
jgi:hypothetical protein